MLGLLAMAEVTPDDVLTYQAPTEGGWIGLAAGGACAGEGGVRWGGRGAAGGERWWLAIISESGAAVVVVLPALAGFLCPLTANEYDVEFLAFKIRDAETGKVRPPCTPTVACTHLVLLSEPAGF